MSNFKQEFSDRVKLINDIITGFLPQRSKTEGNIAEAVEYSILAGGKRIRPIFLLEAFRLFSDGSYDEEEFVYPFATAIEMIHTYSLVHDDLPAMDNDMMRRGKLSTHAAYGEATGILTGDSLLNYSFEIISGAGSRLGEMDISNPCDISYIKEGYRRIMKAAAVMSGKSGIYGMIGGQVLDINGIEVKNSDKKDLKKRLERIYELKTSALIQAALVTGGILGGADDAQQELLDELGYNIGLAFQIWDDILDVTGTSEKLGKEIRSDEKNNKLTYYSLLGQKKSEQEAVRYTEEAIRILSILSEQTGGDIGFLKQLVLYVINRLK